MKIIKTGDFEQAFSELQPSIKRLFLIQELRFLSNPQDPRLHIKKIKGLLFALSFRVTRNYRALFYFRDQNLAIIFDIDHRKDIYRKI